MRTFALPVLVLGVAACAPIQEIAVPQPQMGNVPTTGTPTAGAVSVDITPPPGLPMGGYSMLANRGQGFRTRLKARVVYLDDGNGHALALVQADLPAGSLLVHHKVAAAVAEPTGLRPGDLAITASHSHSAPANFFENDFYNKHMTSGKWLEPSFLDFVTQRISGGILKAHASRRPARVATGRRDIHGYNRNRSLHAHIRNADAGDIDPDDPQAVFRAVNPALFMVRVDVQDESGRYRPLAAFSSFSVHATALTPPVEVYNADLFAYAQRDLEWAIQREHDTAWPVVHALANGTQGDLAPALPQHGDNTFRHFPVDWKAARTLGQGIGREAIGLFEELGSALTSDLTLDSAVRELDIREHNSVEDIRLCRNAVVGNPTAAGAYERRAPWIAALPFFKGGNPMSRRWWFGKDGCQGNKRHLGFSFLQPLMEPKDSFPDTVMFQLLRVNDAVIVPLPFEVTTESGRRMVAGVARELDEAGYDGIRHVWVTSNANGYFGYATTPEEYARQEYEGGHTLYGRHTTPYVTAQLGRLARDVGTRGEVQELAREWRYRVKVNDFYPEVRAGTGERDVLAPPKAVAAKKEHEEDYVRFRWHDVGAARIDFHRPLARVEVGTGEGWKLMESNGVPLHDDGYDLEVRYRGRSAGGMGRYELRWYNPVPGGPYQFVIEPRGGHPPLRSQSFRYEGVSEDGDDRATLVLAP
jgi:neutral ceramidase